MPKRLTVTDQESGQVQTIDWSSPNPPSEEDLSHIFRFKSAPKQPLDLPGIPRPPLPAALQTSSPEERKAAEGQIKQVFAPGNLTRFMAGPLEPVVSGVQHMAQGVETARQAPFHVKPPETPHGMDEAIDQGMRGGARGASQVIGGAMEAGTPLLAGALVRAPLKTALQLGTYELGSQGAEHALGSVGVPPEYSKLIGQVGGLAAGGLAGGFEGDISPRVGEFIKDESGQQDTDALLQHLRGINQESPKLEVNPPLEQPKVEPPKLVEMPEARDYTKEWVDKQPTATPEAFRDTGDTTGLQTPEHTNRSKVVGNITKFLKENDWTGDDLEYMRSDPKREQDFWRTIGRLPGVSKQKGYIPSSQTKQMVYDEMIGEVGHTEEEEPGLSIDVSEDTGDFKVVDAKGKRVSPLDYGTEDEAQKFIDEQGKNVLEMPRYQSTKPGKGKGELINFRSPAERDFFGDESGFQDFAALGKTLSKAKDKAQVAFRLSDRFLDGKKYGQPIIDLLKKSYFDNNSWLGKQFETVNDSLKGFKDWGGLYKYMEGAREDLDPKTTEVGQKVMSQIDDIYQDMSARHANPTVQQPSKASEYIDYLNTDEVFGPKFKESFDSVLANKTTSPKDIIRLYLEASGRALNYRDNVGQARDILKTVPEGAERDAAEFIIDHFSGRPSSNAAIQSFYEIDSALARMGRRSVLPFSGKLQLLHLVRSWTQGVPELGPVAPFKGLASLIKDSKGAYNRAKEAGLLPSKIVPMKFKHPMEKVDQIGNFFDAGNMVARILIHEGMISKYGPGEKAVYETARADGMVTPYSTSPALDAVPKFFFMFKQWAQQYGENVARSMAESAIKRDAESFTKLALYASTLTSAAYVTEKTGYRLIHIKGFNLRNFFDSPQKQSILKFAGAVLHTDKRGNMKPQWARAAEELIRAAPTGASFTQEKGRGTRRHLEVRNPFSLQDQPLRH